MLGVSWAVAGPQQTSWKHLNNWSVGNAQIESDTDTATDTDTYTDTDTIDVLWATSFPLAFSVALALTLRRLFFDWEKRDKSNWIESNRIESLVWSAHKSGVEFVGLWPMPIELAQSRKQMSNSIPVENKMKMQTENLRNCRAVKSFRAPFQKGAK